MKKAVPAVLGALLLLLTTACGDDRGSEQDTRIVANIAEAIGAGDGILTRVQADCVAKKFVAELGVDGLRSAKVVTEDGSYNENGANVDEATSGVYAKALLSCIAEDDALDKIEKKLVAGSAGSQIPAKDTQCYISKLVDTVGLERLMSSRIVTDSGEFNQNASSPDPETAAKSTEALLACVDYYKAEAETRASQNKDLNATKYAACLRKRVSKATLSTFLTSLQSETPDQAAADAAEAEVKKQATICARSATKK